MTALGPTATSEDFILDHGSEADGLRAEIARLSAELELRTETWRAALRQLSEAHDEIVAWSAGGVGRTNRIEPISDAAWTRVQSEQVINRGG